MDGFKTVAVAALFAAGLATGPALAQDPYLGEQEFMERCAVCHGAQGAGDGMVGALFDTKPKDLRVLARESGGAFPYNRVFDAINGRTAIGGHGASEMPIWGDYLMTDAIEARGINPKDARMIVDGRIFALTQYIASIQTR